MNGNYPRVRVMASLVDGWSPAKYQRAREAAGLTFDEVARRCKLARSSVRAWSDQGRPRKEHLPRIARALGVQPEDLLR